MIVMYESTTGHNLDKSVICPKCNRGRLGNIQASSEAILSRRGKPPPIEHGECVQVKCNVTLTSVNFEN